MMSRVMTVVLLVAALAAAPAAAQVVGYVGPAPAGPSTCYTRPSEGWYAWGGTFGIWIPSVSIRVPSVRLWAEPWTGHIYPGLHWCWDSGSRRHDHRLWHGGWWWHDDRDRHDGGSRHGWSGDQWQEEWDRDWRH